MLYSNRCTFSQGECGRYPETETPTKGCCRIPVIQSNPSVCKFDRTDEDGYYHRSLSEPRQTDSFNFVCFVQAKTCLDHRAMPMDGMTLTEALHQHGINIRYLGTVLEYIERIPQKERLDHVYVSVYVCKIRFERVPHAC